MKFLKVAMETPFIPTTPVAPEQTPTPEQFPWKTIAVVIVILALGGVGYAMFGMPKQEDVTSNNKLFPAEFEKFAIGEDADAFIIVRNNDAIKNFITSFNTPYSSEVNKLQNALVVFKQENNKEIAFAALQFDSVDTAIQVKSLLSSQGNLATDGTQIENQENIVTLSKDGGMTAFSGSLLNNPHLKEIDQALIESALIVYADNQKLPGSNIFFTLAQTASFSTAFESEEEEVEKPAITDTSQTTGLIKSTDNPQSIAAATGGKKNPKNNALQALSQLSSFSKNNILFLNVKDNQIQIKLTSQIAAKEEIFELATFKVIEKTAGKNEGTEKEMEEFYQKSLESLEENISQLKNLFSEAINKIPNSSIEVSFENLLLSLELKAPLTGLVETITGNLSSAEQKQRDLVRANHLQQLAINLETYELETGKYPAASSCIEDIEWGKTGPKDPQDPSSGQQFDKEECQTGYYYQYFADSNSYILWAKMEDTEMGNMDQSPAELAESSDSKPIPLSSGEYYIYISKAVNTEKDSSEESTIKVKRPKKE